jgi:serine phosphatase RsbU (regulator of sigma subunit)
MVTNEILNDIPYNELKGAYHQLEKKNKDLLDGLYYAAFVQQGLMPQERHFAKLDHPYLIYYNPLQIIGGDFFWIGKKDDWCFYAVGDCTGHGVSGAMLSSLAIGFLNYVVYAKQYENIGEILSEIDKKWVETFKRNEEEDVNNDWLELSLIAFNKKTGELQFTGAMGNILMINADGFEKIHGSRFPIGGWQIEKSRIYQTKKFNIIPGTKVYLYSDGFKDQFGELTNKRLGSHSFKKLLLSLSKYPMHRQRELLDNHFLLWKGNTEQTDDVCLMAIELG